MVLLGVIFVLVTEHWIRRVFLQYWFYFWKQLTYFMKRMTYRRVLIPHVKLRKPRLYHKDFASIRLWQFVRKYRLEGIYGQKMLTVNKIFCLNLRKIELEYQFLANANTSKSFLGNDVIRLRSSWSWFTLYYHVNVLVVEMCFY